MNDDAGNAEPTRAVPYSHNEDEAKTLAELIEEANQEARSYHDIASLIFRREAATDSPERQAAIRETASTFYYRMEIQRGDTDVAGATLEPLASDTTGTRYWPRPIQQVDTEVQQLWSSLLRHSQSPEVRALLADLLFLVRYDKPHLYARQAVENYILSQEGAYDLLHKSEMLTRAWSIARTVKIEDLDAPLRTAMSTMVSESLDSEDSAPGVVLPVLQCLLEGPMKRNKGQQSPPQ